MDLCASCSWRGVLYEQRLCRKCKAIKELAQLVRLTPDRWEHFLQSELILGTLRILQHIHRAYESRSDRVTIGDLTGTGDDGESEETNLEEQERSRGRCVERQEQEAACKARAGPDRSRTRQGRRHIERRSTRSPLPGPVQYGYGESFQDGRRQRAARERRTASHR